MADALPAVAVAGRGALAAAGVAAVDFAKAATAACLAAVPDWTVAAAARTAAVITATRGGRVLARERRVLFAPPRPLSCGFAVLASRFGWVLDALHVRRFVQKSQSVRRLRMSQKPAWARHLWQRTPGIVPEGMHCGSPAILLGFPARWKKCHFYDKSLDHFL
jgi:hypothetical protein